MGILARNAGCRPDETKVDFLNGAIQAGYHDYMNSEQAHNFLHLDTELVFEHSAFDDDYLFSDAVSLYLKGVNIFPKIFGDKWEKYCPIISLNEIKRVVTKTIDKRSTKS